MVGRKLASLFTILIISLAVLPMLGAGPSQAKPPQPFGPDSFSGQVVVQGQLALRGMQLYACIDNCEVYLSVPVRISQGGMYNQLVVSPPDRSLVGHPILFYLSNEFGRIQADEVVDFQGATQIFTHNLNFKDPVPFPTATPTITPTASLPAPGDPSVTAIPRMALILGGVTLLAGSGVLLILRRRAA